MWVNLANGEVAPAGAVAATYATDKSIADIATASNNFSAAQTIAIDFLTFRDGRGFSLAHLLRREVGFGGKLVAVGSLLPDQAQMLYRSGFDFAAIGDKKITDWQDAIKSFSVFYQTAIR